MSYAENKRKAVTYTKEKTQTDQAGARETDLNIIVSRYLTQGILPGAAKPPEYGDFSQLPRDLRGFIEQARSIEQLRGELPEGLKHLTVEDLVEMDAEALTNYLKPKEVSKPETPKETA